MDFSLFYFADDAQVHTDRYRLLLDGARFADTHGFTAVWTPERHFHRFGGLFPNPAVSAAAVAAVTSRVGVRAGSVVAPLHHPLRIAEEWAMVDNLSGGRAGVSLASGWHPRDFVFAPGGYADRRQRTLDTVETLRRLWRGEEYEGGYQIFPPPVQPEIPMWLTSGGGVETFEAAGKLGVGLLTHLLAHTVEELGEKVARYRRCFADSGRPGRGHVVLMVHTYLDEDLPAAERQVREPLQRYLVSSLDLNRRANAAASGEPAPEPMSEARARFLVTPAYKRYLRQDGLFGSVEQALRAVDRIRTADVDEIACLVDFGVPVDAALAGLDRLEALRRAAR